MMPIWVAAARCKLKSSPSQLNVAVATWTTDCVVYASTLSYPINFRFTKRIRKHKKLSGHGDGNKQNLAIVIGALGVT